MSMIRRSLATPTTGLYEDLLLLIVRVVAASLMITNGWQKLSGYNEMLGMWQDPIGIGLTPSLMLAIFAEFFCSALLILGLLTRFAALNLMITMSVAAFIVHAADPLKVKELALLYLTVFLVPFVKGAGKFSIDRALS
jgi:putative oxidoreductase